MTTNYKSSRDVPPEVIVARLKELSDAVTGGRESLSREFTMRIPAECDRDADLIIGEAAIRLDRLAADNEALRARVAELSVALESLREPWDLGNILGAETRRRVEAADQALSGDFSKSWLLRKQAEAVERFSDGLDRKAGAALWDLEDFQKHSRAEAQRLRAEASDIEREENHD